MLLSLLAEIEAVFTRANELVVDVEKLSDGALSGTEGVRAGAAGLEVAIRAVLRQLDILDEIALLSVVDGPRALAVWKWRRDTRASLLGIWRQVHVIAETSAEVGSGRRQRVVYVSEGDTWQAIAQRELGGWEEWPRLLKANPALSPISLTAGTAVVVPERL